MDSDGINWRTVLYLLAVLIVIIGTFTLKNYQSMVLDVIVVLGLIGTDRHAAKKDNHRGET